MIPDITHFADCTDQCRNPVARRAVQPVFKTPRRYAERGWKISVNRQAGDVELVVTAAAGRLSDRQR
jgi:hypothetical protein